MGGRVLYWRDMLEGWLAHFAHFFQQYGYWAVFFFLLLENAGFPVPGETVLLYASFLAYQGEGLKLSRIIPVGIVAATLGDNAGYWLGRKGGPRVARLLHLTPRRLQYFKNFFHRYGDWTIFFARFIAGLRVVAGPAAGLSQMEWRRFVLFNAMGAVVWVNCIGFAGFFLGRNWPLLIRWLKRTDLALLIIAGLILAYLVRRHRADQ
jgi:membrane protein DedA with SNARE-associated domain